MKPSELHRHHLAHDAKGTGWRVDLGHAASIRIETQAGSMTNATKKAIALRVAVCWNVLEGIPTDELLGGAVRKCYEAARTLCDSLEADGLSDAPELKTLVDAFRAADRALADVTTAVKCTCGEAGEVA